MIEEVELLNINVTDIIFTDRARENYKDIDLLARDIKAKGLIQPIAVEREGDKFRLLAGGRRFSAVVFAEMQTISCRVFPAGLTALERKEIELMENLSREDFDWKEQVQLTEEIHQLQIAKHGEAVGSSEGHSATDTAKLMGVSAMQVSRDRKLVAGLADHAEELAGAKNKSEALRTLKKIAKREENQAAVATMEQQLAKDAGEKLKRTLLNSYIIGDFFAGVKNVPDRAVNFIEIDPPYAIALDKIKRGADTKTSPGIESYNEVDVSEYGDFLDKLFVECYRVAYPNAWLCCWYGIQWHTIVQTKLEDAGWKVVHIPGIWMKVRHQGQTRNPELRLGSVWEPFFYARKGEATIRESGRTNAFSYQSLHPDHKVHPTERPIEMITELIKTFTAPNGHVMVPFLGSGNSLLAASNAGCTAFGFDLGTEYKDAFTKRVLDGTPGKYASYASLK